MGIKRGQGLAGVAAVSNRLDEARVEDFRWSVLGAGSSQYKIATQSATLGANLRVGLEDSLWAGKGELASSNKVQVLKMRTIVEALGLKVATADEARKILELKGGDQVAF